MKTVFIELDFSGHKLAYVAQFGKLFLRKGDSVTFITSQNAAQSEQYREFIQPILSELTVHVAEVDKPVARTDGARDLLAREFGYHRIYQTLYRQYIRESGAGLVFLPYLDACAYAAALIGSPFGRFPYSGLVMRPRFHYSQMQIEAPPDRKDPIQRFVYKRLLSQRRLPCLFTIDKPFADWASLEQSESRNKVKYVPDVVEPPIRSVDCYKTLNLRPDRRYVLVYGALTTRKGIRKLVQALGDPEFPKDCDLLLVGQANPNIAALADSASLDRFVAAGRIHLKEGFASKEIEAAAFAAADTVWLGYDGHFGSSGVIGLAAAAGKPVISCREGVLGWETKTAGLGLVLENNSPSEIALKVKAVLPDRVKDKYRKSLENFFQERTEQALEKAFSSAYSSLS